MNFCKFSGNCSERIQNFRHVSETHGKTTDGPFRNTPASGRQPEQKRAQARHRPAAGENPGTGRNPPAAPCGPVRRSARTERAFPAKTRRRTSARRPQREGQAADGARHYVQPGEERESPHSARCAVWALNIRQRPAGTGARKMRIIFSHYPPPGGRSARRGSDKCRSSEETGPAC